MVVSMVVSMLLFSLSSAEGTLPYTDSGTGCGICRPWLRCARTRLSTFFFIYMGDSISGTYLPALQAAPGLRNVKLGSRLNFFFVSIVEHGAFYRVQCRTHA